MSDGMSDSGAAERTSPARKQGGIQNLSASSNAEKIDAFLVTKGKG